MPNGFQGNQEEWKRVDSPLEALDSFLEGYAQKHGFNLTKYYHNWPERSLQTEKNQVRKKIQISLANVEKPTYKIWAVVAQDNWTPKEGFKRLWKETTIKSDLIPPISTADLQKWLDEARNFIARVKKSDLVET